MDTQKQQVAERIKQANNILVTVSTNPSVDQLAACIGLTLSLNKMGKHATAVFSGDIPSTIEFLQPEKTIEKNTDSLRDFIIALDKAKADKLRYKVEDRVVKIFITPYRTSISDKDLEFSQGDFNVDVVLALGVHAQTDLDQAITAHGRILHDATVVTLNVRPGGELGSLNWLDPNASSLSELAVQLVDMMQKNLMDGQIATAMLTGIVAETERFSNGKTSPQTMSISAELMSLGANQQLVATKLEEPVAPPPMPPGPIAQQDAHAGDAKDLPPAPKKPDDGTLEIAHDDKNAQAEGQGSDQGSQVAQADDHPAEEPALADHQEEHPAPPEEPGESKPEAESEPEHPKIHDVKTVGDDAKPHEAKKEEPKQPEPLDTSALLPEPEAPQIDIPAPEAYEPPTPPPQIHIDEHGALSPLQSEADEEADAAALLPPKSQESPTISHHSEAPKMVLEPPTLGGQLTANATPDSFGAAGDDEDTAAGMPGMPEHEMPMLGGSPPPSPAAATPGLPLVPIVAPDSPESGNAPGTSFLGDQPLEEPSQKPMTPAPNETLNDIERDVHSTHLDAQPAADTIGGGAAAATPGTLEPTSATEPAFIETPVPSTPAPNTPSAPASTQVPIVAPDDLTPEEVANAFTMGQGQNEPAPPPLPDLSSLPPAGASYNAPMPPPAPAAPQGQLGVNDQGYGDVGNARDAVAQAFGSAAGQAPDPIQALNANPLGPPLGSGTTPSGGALPLAEPQYGPDPNAPPVQPWTPPADAGVPQAVPPPNPATQFDPAAFGQPPLPENQPDPLGQTQPQAAGAPPSAPPPMMPPL